MRVTKDIGAAFFLLALSVIAIYGVNDLTLMSAVFPLTISILLLVLSLIYLLQSVIKINQAKMEFGQRGIMLALGSIGYIFLIWLIGFLWASLLFMCFFSIILQEKSKRNQKGNLVKTIMLTSFLVLLFYLLFTLVFHVPLP